MTPPDDAGRGYSVGLVLVSVTIVALAGIDATADVMEGASWGHVLSEVATALLGLVLLVLVVVRWRAAWHEARARRRELEHRLAETRDEAARWRAEAASALAGLASEIDRQLERWALSTAEKEVALLLLKGLSLKEVADVRGVTEATARQQARAVYKKAGLTGRHDLAAFFLEDLLTPSQLR